MIFPLAFYLKLSTLKQKPSSLCVCVFDPGELLQWKKSGLFWIGPNGPRSRRGSRRQSDWRNAAQVHPTGRDEGSRGAEGSHRADGSPAVPRPAAGGGKLRAVQGETWRFHPDACCKSFCSLALMQEMSLYLERSAGKGYWIPCHIQWGPDVWEHFCLAFLCFRAYAFHLK